MTLHRVFTTVVVSILLASASAIQGAPSASTTVLFSDDFNDNSMSTSWATINGSWKS